VKPKILPLGEAIGNLESVIMINKELFMRISLRLFYSVVAVLALSFIWSCQSVESPQEPVVMYARYGDLFRHFEIKVYSDRSVIYKGVRNVKTIGERRFKVSESQYAKLMQAFAVSDISTMDSVYGSAICDSPAPILLEIASNEKTKTVRAFNAPCAVLPARLYKLMWAIEDALALENLLCPAEVKVSGGSTIDACAMTREVENKLLREEK
jgi:hypothetical protein